jgi:Ni/Co efflux regulator RcnB
MSSAFRSDKVISTTLAAAVLFGVLAFVSAPRSFADDKRAECQHRIEKAEARLADAIRDHGDRSSEAAKRRHELNDEREHCYQETHAWYNGQDRQWHNDRDWDHDDHDRDHDQH